MSTLTFNDLDLSPELLNGLRDLKYEEATKLQQSVIPHFLENKDLLIRAEDEKGREESFVIPALQILLRKEQKKAPRILFLTPHPEDAQSLDELVWAMGYHAQIECVSIDLDGDWDEQEKSLEEGVSVVAANPGRLIEILEKNRFVFRDLELVVIDKANEMISLNLTSMLESIDNRIISEPQVAIFSEEFNDDVKEFANRLLDEPTVVGFGNVRSNGELTKEPPTLPGSLKQGYIKVPDRMKITTLMAHIKSTPSENCVIFTASKRGTDRLYRVFRKRGLKATSIHDKLADEKRQQRFSNFTNGDVQYLLVADISAAELGLDNVMQVINYDVPGDADEYRYRASLVGTGKANRIVSLVSKQDRSDINQLQNELGETPTELPLPDEVKKKLEERRKKQKQRDKRPKRGSKKKREKRMELPRPSYDKLSGGRSGKKEEKSGVIGFFKKLFS